MAHFSKADHKRLRAPSTASARQPVSFLKARPVACCPSCAGPRCITTDWGADLAQGSGNSASVSAAVAGAAAAPRPADWSLHSSVRRPRRAATTADGRLPRPGCGSHQPRAARDTVLSAPSSREPGAPQRCRAPQGQLEGAVVGHAPQTAMLLLLSGLPVSGSASAGSTVLYARRSMVVVNSAPSCASRVGLAIQRRHPVVQDAPIDLNRERHALKPSDARCRWCAPRRAPTLPTVGVGVDVGVPQGLVERFGLAANPGPVLVMLLGAVDVTRGWRRRSHGLADFPRRAPCHRRRCSVTRPSRWPVAVQAHTSAARRRRSWWWWASPWYSSDTGLRQPPGRGVGGLRRNSPTVSAGALPVWGARHGRSRNQATRRCRVAGRGAHRVPDRPARRAGRASRWCVFGAGGEFCGETMSAQALSAVPVGGRAGTLKAHMTRSYAAWYPPGVSLPAGPARSRAHRAAPRCRAAWRAGGAPGWLSQGPQTPPVCGTTARSSDRRLTPVLVAQAQKKERRRTTVCGDRGARAADRADNPAAVDCRGRGREQRSAGRRDGAQGSGARHGDPPAEASRWGC